MVDEAGVEPASTRVPRAVFTGVETFLAPGWRV